MSTAFYTETVRATRPMIDGGRVRTLRVARELRALLEPLLPLIADSSVSRTTRQRRSVLFVDWSLRRGLPLWLRSAGLDGLANALATLPLVDGPAVLADAIPAVLRARWESLLLSRQGAVPHEEDYLSPWFTAWRTVLAEFGAASALADSVDGGLARDAWSALEQSAHVVGRLPMSFESALSEMSESVQALIVRICGVRERRVRPGLTGRRLPVVDGRPTQHGHGWPRG